ncbi:hypothetical protein [Methylobacter marinus]|uniref:hypothetical protein n=1 Tax=Methylobacter marinus TaxID=34058 RepID=UPI00037F25C1|nr:hypothetical protein [Methylobacter marinus]
MINITLDLGEAPSVLAALSHPALAQQLVNVAAESYVDDMHDWIDAGRAFTPREGQLQQSINWHPLGNGAAVIYANAANAAYAGFVEDGTAPHVIEPKPGRKGLKIPAAGGGGYVIRRRVNHPGSRPHPFFFADQADRSRRMQERALSVLAARIGV